MRKADWFGKLRAALGRKQRQEIGAAMICVEEEAPAAGGGPLVVGRRRGCALSLRVRPYARIDGARIAGRSQGVGATILGSASVEEVVVGHGNYERVDVRGARPGLAAIACGPGRETDRARAWLVHGHGAGGYTALRWDPAGASAATGARLRLEERQEISRGHCCVERRQPTITSRSSSSVREPTRSDPLCRLLSVALAENGDGSVLAQVIFLHPGAGIAQ